MPTDWTPAGNPAPGLATLAQRQAALARIQVSFNAKMDELAHKLQTGKIKFATWETYMRTEIRGLQTAALIISRGGDPKAITADDRAMLNATLKEQYKYLHNFALQAQARAYLVETGQGDFFSEKYMATRSKLYGGAAGAMFYRSFCYDLLPQIPGDGQTPCLTNCKCVLEFKQGDAPEIIEVRWLLRPAEHCDPCVHLSETWNPYVLTLPEGLSASDWVTWLPRLRASDLALGPGRGWWGPERGGTHGGSGKGAFAEAKPFIAMAITQVQKDGIDTGNEAAIICDASGSKINGTVRGDKDSVSGLSQLVNSKTVEAFALVHNHPSSASFSPEDATVLIDSNLKHIIAVGNDGTVYILSKPKEFRKLAATKVYKQIWEESFTKYMAEYQADVAAGKVSGALAWKEHSHRAMVDFAAFVHLDYRRITP